MTSQWEGMLYDETESGDLPKGIMKLFWMMEKSTAFLLWTFCI